MAKGLRHAVRPKAFARASVFVHVTGPKDVKSIEGQSYAVLSGKGLFAVSLGIFVDISQLSRALEDLLTYTIR